MEHPEKECTYKNKVQQTNTNIVIVTNTSGGGVITPAGLTAENEQLYKTRLFYNSKVVPTEIEALLARKP